MGGRVIPTSDLIHKHHLDSLTVHHGSDPEVHLFHQIAGRWPARDQSPVYHTGAYRMHTKHAFLAEKPSPTGLWPDKMRNRSSAVWSQSVHQRPFAIPVSEPWSGAVQPKRPSPGTPGGSALFWLPRWFPNPCKLWYDCHAHRQQQGLLYTRRLRCGNLRAAKFLESRRGHCGTRRTESRRILFTA